MSYSNGLKIINKELLIIKEVSKIKIIIYSVISVISLLSVIISVMFFNSELDKSVKLVEQNIQEDYGIVVDKNTKTTNKIITTSINGKIKSNVVPKTNYSLDVNYKDVIKTFNVTSNTYNSYTEGDSITLYTLDDTLNIDKSNFYWKYIDLKPIIVFCISVIMLMIFGYKLLINLICLN